MVIPTCAPDRTKDSREVTFNARTAAASPASAWLCSRFRSAATYENSWATK
jgi:hypothetical protein